MTAELYFAFVAATVVLMAIPGPNVALIAATSITHGVRYGLITVAGTTSAMVLQLAIVGAGLSGFLLVLADWFEVLRWCGVLYLVLLGITMWRSNASDSDKNNNGRRNYKIVFMRGFLVSLTNPKMLLFYGAFFPQFIVPDVVTTRQILLLAMTFVGIAITIDSLWALAASRLERDPLILKRILH